MIWCIKKNLTLFFLLIVVNVFTQNLIIKNGGFESWGTYTYFEIQGFQTSNQFSCYKNIWGNINRSGNAYHGTDAIQLVTKKLGTDTVPGYIYNGDLKKKIGQGGIPYSEKPTGIRFFYIPNFEVSDTGIVVVIFKKNGLKIATHIDKLYGVNTSYLLYSFDFTTILTQTPDSVIFGISTSDFIKGKKGKAFSSMIVDSVSFTGVSNQPSWFNGDFEDWYIGGYSGFPYWQTSFRGYNQTSNSFAGSRALSLTNYLDSSYACQTPFATNGKLNYNNTITGGDAFYEQIDTLKFRYIYSTTDLNDSGKVDVFFKKLGVTFHNYSEFLPVSSLYKLVEIPFNLSQAPDSVIIILTPSKTNNPPVSSSGSNLIIDEICFKSHPLTTSLNKLINEPEITLYPNPSLGILNISFIDRSMSSNIIISNIIGKEVLSSKINIINKQATIDVSSLPKGIYTIELHFENKSIKRQFIKE